MTTTTRKRRNPLQVLRQEKTIKGRVTWYGSRYIKAEDETVDRECHKEVSGTLDALRNWSRREMSRLTHANNAKDETHLEIYEITIEAFGPFEDANGERPLWKEVGQWQHAQGDSPGWTYPDDLRAILTEAREV